MVDGCRRKTLEVSDTKPNVPKYEYNEKGCKPRRERSKYIDDIAH